MKEKILITKEKSSRPEKKFSEQIKNFQGKIKIIALK